MSGRRTTLMSGKQSGYGGQTKPVFHKKAKTVCPQGDVRGI